MLSINRVAIYLIVLRCIFGGSAAVAGDDIGCPPTRNGRPLKTVSLFAGPPSDKIELMPQDGRFVVPRIPQDEWPKTAPYTLVCSYSGLENMAIVVLPHSIRACDFLDDGRVACH